MLISAIDLLNEEQDQHYQAEPLQPLPQPLPQPLTGMHQHPCLLCRLLIYPVAPITGFRYQTPHSTNVQSRLGTFPGIQRSRHWITERQRDTPGVPSVTSCVSATVSANMGDDIEFKLRTSWDDGWELINALDFAETVVLAADSSERQLLPH